LCAKMTSFSETGGNGGSKQTKQQPKLPLIPPAAIRSSKAGNQKLQTAPVRPQQQHELLAAKTHEMRPNQDTKRAQLGVSETWTSVDDLFWVSVAVFWLANLEQDLFGLPIDWPAARIQSIRFDLSSYAIPMIAMPSLVGKRFSLRAAP